MRQLLQSLNTPPQFHLPKPPPHPQIKTAKLARAGCKISRRDLAVSGSTIPLLIATYFWSSQAQANSDEPSTGISSPEADSMKNDCTNQPTTKKAFLDVSIDGEPAGRIIIGLYGDSTPFGSSRFASLVTGTAGISYRRKEFVKIMPNYIQHGGIRSYGVDAELANRTGSNLATDDLVSDWEAANKKCPGTKNTAGSLGIVIRDPTKPPPKLKLVARKGKLEIDEEVGTDPNGTEFLIATKDSLELDASTLVVGKVVEGMDVVERISKVKTVQENTGSPYFR